MAPNNLNRLFFLEKWTEREKAFIHLVRHHIIWIYYWSIELALYLNHVVVIQNVIEHRGVHTHRQSEKFYHICYFIFPCKRKGEACLVSVCIMLNFPFIIVILVKRKKKLIINKPLINLLHHSSDFCCLPPVLLLAILSVTYNCADLIVGTSGLEPPTFWILVMNEHWEFHHEAESYECPLKLKLKTRSEQITSQLW